ncbi:nucleotidyltransferase family protein [Sediminibacter sp. Hel_I_10]|uniref:nucleotidyltransferase family protein n=1 Tax=Sediminibacter sp. Hel_I_10 TaxID=1392490 RepID=UPI00047B0BF2|nr:nucleotidyltransferase family protein [Sediminibacter sp. Hel_I_10]
MNISSSSYQSTFQLIVDILSFKHSHQKLDQFLSASSIDWENLVKIASSHLVLTAVYCRLEQKQLLHHLPEDLKSYLFELSSINRNRNLGLIKEIDFIGNILNQNDIEHVFIKGATMLVSNCYQDPAERMVGDIDVLIKSVDLQRAFDLIQNNGYSESKGFNYKVKEFRHLDRQIDENRLAAIELHDQILIKRHKDLINLDNLFETKISVNGINIPRIDFLQHINILTTEINNYNYYYNQVNLKNIYDHMILEQKKDYFSLNQSYRNKYINHFLSLYQIWTNSRIITGKSYYLKNQTRLYQLKIKHKRLASFVFKAKFYILNISQRLILVFRNTSYLKHLLKNKIFVKSSANFIL